jgi:hypothetical protein
MFLRRMLVTNSSTTSHVYYGISLTDEETEKLFGILLQTASADVVDEIKHYWGDIKGAGKLIDDAKVGLEGACTLLMELIQEEQEELGNWGLQQLLVNSQYKDLRFEGGSEDIDEYTNVLRIYTNFDTELVDGKVVITDITEESYGKFIELAGKLGVEYPDPAVLSWATADY